MCVHACVHISIENRSVCADVLMWYFNMSEFAVCLRLGEHSRKTAACRVTVSFCGGVDYAHLFRRVSHCFKKVGSGGVLNIWVASSRQSPKDLTRERLVVLGPPCNYNSQCYQ